MNPGERAVGVR